MCFRISINGFADDFAASCENAAVAAVEAEGKIINGGRTATSLILGYSVLWQPMSQPVNPHEGKTINRRAGCGRSASPVRREGGAELNRSSLPLSLGLIGFDFRSDLAPPAPDSAAGGGDSGDDGDEDQGEHDGVLDSRCGVFVAKKASQLYASHGCDL